MAETSDGKERVIAYIDGFNLYFGLKESGYNRYFWLNIDALVRNLLKPNQTLVGIKYFTSLVTDDVQKRLRQKAYTNALLTIPSIRIIWGVFQKEKAICKACGNTYYASNEKMTDVNIATQIIDDYYNDNFDMAMLISGDTDLIPPTKLVNESPNNKRVFVAFPPNRINDDVRKHAKGSIVIGRKILADSQFSNSVIDSNGETINKPTTWV